MKISYRNPLTKAYQREYALYMEMCARLGKVTCRSAAVKTLALYYAELVKENRDTGNVSYEAQYRLEEKMKELVTENVAGKVPFPDGAEIKASVITGSDGLHTFIFAGRTRALAVRLDGNRIRSRALKVTKAV